MGLSPQAEIEAAVVPAGLVMQVVMRRGVVPTRYRKSVVWSDLHAEHWRQRWICGRDQAAPRQGHPVDPDRPRLAAAAGCIQRSLEVDSTQCDITVVTDAEQTARAFKTAWFAKAARKARIKDDELCEALQKAMKGQADDLGGGVFKKRLNKNMHRSIILAKGGRYWIYEYLFAKKDRANIEDHELQDFRTLAKRYATLSEEQIAWLWTTKT